MDAAVSSGSGLPSAQLTLAAPGLTGGLDAWAPADWPVAADWVPVVADFWASGAGRQLGDFVAQRLRAGATVYPAQPLRALALTPLAEVRVVILGQDPYHGPGQAEGLAFSVPPGVRLPPSLRNIFKELAREAAQPADLGLPGSGSLVRWARQGVLLLNTCLTVEQGQAGSHAGRGWELLTEALLRAVLARSQPVVFMLWGAHAQKFAPLVSEAADPQIGGAEEGRLCVLTANHPSPLSALRAPQPFLGCGHFGLANDFLVSRGVPKIDW